MAATILERLEWGLLPAVPVPFRGTDIDLAAQRGYAAWMARQPVAGVAVWSHTGRGPHLSPEQRHTVLETWREAMPDRVIVAGATDITSAIEARRGRADALLIFPERKDPVAHHARLSRELPGLAFYLYEAAGGVPYDDATLHAIMDLPGIAGIKVATLDSVMTFQRIAAVMRSHPGKLLVTGEDRFLGYSLMLGARAALIGMGAALPDVQAGLLRSYAEEDWPRFMRLSRTCDDLAQVTFMEPMEGTFAGCCGPRRRRAVPPASCDDPWGPALPQAERHAIERMVGHVRSSAA